MTNQAEFERELRGLLEDIVGDPRSSLRLTSRRALDAWFDGGEAIAARSAGCSSAERHLVEAHREALAATLLEAAKIAYWKAPILSLRPLNAAQGKPYDERAAEERWRPAARRRSERTSYPSEGLPLLRACLGHIAPEHGHSLAQASLALVPSDAARFYVTRTLPWERPRTAAALLDRLARRTTGGLRVDALSSLAARLCAMGRYPAAIAKYREAAALAPDSPSDRCFVFNLSCLVGDEPVAIAVARELAEIVEPRDPRVLAARDLCRGWWLQRSPDERSRARRFMSRLSGRSPEIAAVLSEAFAT